MKNTKFVSAGAGSGKTYSLTQEIARMVSEGRCQAEQIILTTFTEAAANELREKVRSTLYSEGHYEAAMNIDNAAIGTIHSIAYQFVSRYWYLLGISANVSIMDNEGSKFCISQSLASLPSKVDMDLFDNVLNSFNVTKSINNRTIPDPDFWKKELKDIIDKTIELCIDEKQLEEAKEESKRLLLKVIKWNCFDITSDIFASTKDSLTKIFNAIADNARKDKEAKRKELLDSLDALKDDRKIEGLPISKLYSLLKNNVAEPKGYLLKNLPDDVNYLQDIYEKIPASNQVRDLVESYIDALFCLAIQWKREYEEFKRKRCLLDFGDLLQKFDELLNNEEVVADIRSRYKVAFVDEFQDCSPLQVQSFERLSELVEQSVWVGDIKQAIYGFRGTNTELIQSVIGEVERGDDGNKLDRLKCCWRSNKTIVDLVNNIFCEKVFCGQLPKDLIELKMPERTESDLPAPKEQKLQHMHFVCGRKEDVPEALADKVKELIACGAYKANEIAILYRNNSDVAKCTAALKEIGVAYNVHLDNDNSNNGGVDVVSSFISAVISFAAQGDNELSKAVIANRIENGYSISKLLTDRLQCIGSDSKEWLSDVDVINRISNIRKTIGNQSVSAAIETVVVELNLVDLIKRIDPSAPAYNYCSALETKVATYEGMCASFGLSSTLVGFVDYLKQHPIEYPGDDNGVSVMTYHKSKGLEWPCVILCSLNNAPADAKRTYFGVLAYNTATETSLRLIPSAIKELCSGIMDRFEDNKFFQEIKRATINEAKRLMYVGMTRPKEQLVLTTYGTNNGDDWLTSIGCDAMIDSHAATQTINWGGAIWSHIFEPYVAPEQEDEVTEAIEFVTLKQPTEHQSFEGKFISPSKVKTDKQLYSVRLCGSFADRISAIATDGRDSTVGDFIHHLMCLWSGDRSIVGKLAEAYGVKVDVESVAKSIENFWTWMEKTYGKAISTERELPFSFTNDLGQIVTGEIDLVYHTAEGDVLVDYKTYQGGVANITDMDSDFYAGKYGGQLALYEEALKHSGCIVRERLVCYLSLGVVVKIE